MPRTRATRPIVPRRMTSRRAKPSRPPSCATSSRASWPIWTSSPSTRDNFSLVGIGWASLLIAVAADLVEFCESMANAGKIILVAALDGTFERKVCFGGLLSRGSLAGLDWQPFGSVLQLVPLAEQVIKLSGPLVRSFAVA